MLKIFISSHGKLASAVKNSIDILLGNSRNIYAFDAYIDEKSIKDALNQFYNDYVFQEDQVILLSDLLGGSVNTMMAPYTEQKNTILISGFNLGLVMELSLRSQSLNKEEINQIIEEVKSGIKIVDIDNEEIVEDFF